MMTTNEMVMYDEMVEMGIATSEELNLVRNVMCGTWEEILEAVLYARTGYHTMEQMMDEEE